MSEPELKPCPFCGGEAQTFFSITPTETFAENGVTCVDCGAQGEMAVSKKTAIAAWNKRSGEGERVKELEGGEGESA